MGSAPGAGAHAGAAIGRRYDAWPSTSVTAFPTSRAFPAPTGCGRCARRAARRPRARSTTDDPRGSLGASRGSSAAYLRRVRAADADPESHRHLHRVRAGPRPRTSGTARSAAQDRVAFEDPGQRTPRLRRPRRSPVLKLMPASGRRSRYRRERSSTRPAPGRFVVTPAHQWPSGVVLAPERRLELVGVGTLTRDATIIEDDYDAEFRYDREPVGMPSGARAQIASSVDRHGEQVARALACASAGWSARLHCSKRSRSRNGSPTVAAPAIDQLALATLIESGRYDRHLRRMRLMYAAAARGARELRWRSTRRR